MSAAEARRCLSQHVTTFDRPSTAKTVAILGVFINLIALINFVDSGIPAGVSTPWNPVVVSMYLRFVLVVGTPFTNGIRYVAYDFSNIALSGVKAGGAMV